jgi:predicted Fe-Mo cluster-binding NifX family protein
MKIAVTYANGQVFQHFGHTEQFKVYDVDMESRTVKSAEVFSAVGSGHGALSDFLKNLGVEALICGGIGGGARTALKDAGIILYPGVLGDADQSVSALLNETLNYNPYTVCQHHHHEDGHDCASHNCGEDKHGCAGNH